MGRVREPGALGIRTGASAGPHALDGNRQLLIVDDEPDITSSMRDFLEAYRGHSKGAASLPDDEAAWQTLLDFFLLHKAIYETGYELSNRPAWIGIPLRGIIELLGQSGQ